MTLLLAGSILLIAGSAIALIAGWVNAEETYIWTSIAATATAAVLLVVAFYRSKATAAPLPGDGERGAEIDPEILADREERASSKYARQTSRGEEEGAEGAKTQVLAPDAPPPEGPGETEEGSATTAATVGPPAGEADAGAADADDGDTKAMAAGDAEQPDAGEADTKATDAGDSEQPHAGDGDTKNIDAGAAEQPDAGGAEDPERR